MSNINKETCVIRCTKLIIVNINLFLHYTIDCLLTIKIYLNKKVINYQLLFDHFVIL